MPCPSAVIHICLASSLIFEEEAASLVMFVSPIFGKPFSTFLDPRRHSRDPPGVQTLLEYLYLLQNVVEAQYSILHPDLLVVPNR